MSETRIDTPRIYDWQINENSNRYEYQRSQPGDENILRIQFSILGSINAIVALTTFTLILTILKNEKIRENPFNLYLLFIALPDFIASASCFLTCIMSAPDGRFYSEAMCGWQSFYLCFAITANAWMNTVIINQIHRLLRYSRQRRRYFPPTRRTVMQHTAAVYAMACVLACIAALPIPGLPIRTHLYNGLACYTMEYDTVSSYIFYFGFCPLTLGIPVFYAAVVVAHVQWRTLLPSTGRRRKISVFLLRIIAFYYICWFPFLILSVVGNWIRVNTWVFWLGAAASHLQGVVTVVVVYYTNDEIREKILGLLLCCGCHLTNEAPPQSSFRLSTPIQTEESSVPRTLVGARQCDADLDMNASEEGEVAKQQLDDNDNDNDNDNDDDDDDDDFLVSKLDTSDVQMETHRFPEAGIEAIEEGCT